jgi:hypothetical protein
MKRRGVLPLLVAAGAAGAAGADEVVFLGHPMARLDADGKEAKLTELNADAGDKFACRIVRRGRAYIWANRGNRRLERIESGDFTYYVSPEGSGYVKVLEIREQGVHPFDYVEHVTSGFKTVTYWGREAEKGSSGD